MKIQQRLFFLSLLISVFSLNAEVGKVLFAVGNVQVERQTIQTLKRGDAIMVGDILTTGDKSRLQILFNDNARVSLRPNSQLIVDDYFYDKNANNKQVTSSKEATSAFSLVKGGFRTITGAIAAGDDKTGYKVKTAVATIGIRGTDYSILLCNNDCLPLPNSQKPVENGLYAGVSTGAIVLINNAGEVQLNNSESGFVKTFNSQPVKLLGPPRSLFGQTAPIKKASKSNSSQNKSLNVPKSLLLTNNTPFSDTSDISEPQQIDNEEIIISKKVVDDEGNEIIIDDGNFASSNIAGNFSFANNSQPLVQQEQQLTLDERGNLIGFTANDGNYSIGNAANKNLGFDPITGFRWGRWQGEEAQFNDTPLDLTAKSLHWLTNDLANSGEFALIQTGSASYQLIGNTEPTNNLGDTGVLGSAEFSADFTNQTVFSSLSLGINGNNWQASGTGSIAQGINYFSGNYSDVLINGQTQGRGSFSGLFSPNIETNGAPLGAGLTYSLSDNNAIETINGVLVFANQK
ncbi:FecR family protein [Pseudoalteromonas piratica]|uniref:FecR protein domain-containing protein n=1 Tax=Pseudoalteromonas piratica TaxID=1348114 RepID=A0A0A7ELS0_9GAMM|nr:FecR family protein [Pseudoalteromonas piratica]AIY66927.1 hypothetical protein OM33_17730 [Pseudoalteromonas piratica]